MSGRFFSIFECTHFERERGGRNGERGMVGERDGKKEEGVMEGRRGRERGEGGREGQKLLRVKSHGAENDCGIENVS